MGNGVGVLRSAAVDERYTRPQGLYDNRDIDYVKLRRLILDSQLAPCFSGDEERRADLEECPICFLFYPSLNRSICCKKSICTECFLRIRPHDSNSLAQCPFCKTSNYAVEYRGARTEEEKVIEQIEDQRVIEAQLRMQSQEMLNEEEREVNGEEHKEVSNGGLLDLHWFFNMLSIRTPAQQDGPIVAQSPPEGPMREDNFEMDAEDMMLMEAILLSIKEFENQTRSPHGNDGSASGSTGPSSSQPTSPLVPSFGRLVRPVAALLELLPVKGVSIGSLSFTPRLGISASAAAAAATSLLVETGSSDDLIPDTFEEQLMLATAVSLSEAQERAPTTL